MWVREMEGWSLMESPRSFRGDHWTLNSGMLKFEVEDGVDSVVIVQRMYGQGVPRLITDVDLHRSEGDVHTITRNMDIQSTRVPLTKVHASIPKKFHIARALVSSQSN